MSGAGNTGGGSSNDNNSGYFKWSPQFNSVFIELLDEELQKIDYITTIPYREGKKNIVKKFKERTGKTIDWDKCKHKHDDFKMLYTAYKRLSRRTGISFERGTGRIIMDEVWWNDRKKDTEGASRLKKNPLPCIDLMEKVFGPHCAVNDNMMSASQLHEDGEDEDDEEEELEEDEEENPVDSVPETQSEYSAREFQPQQSFRNQPVPPSIPIEIPTQQRRGQGGNRAGGTTSRGRGQSNRQTNQNPRRRDVMDTHLTNIQSYLSTMQGPIQMLNARNQANEDYERES